MDNDLSAPPAVRTYALRPSRRLLTVLFGMFFTFAGPGFLSPVIQEAVGIPAAQVAAPALLFLAMSLLTTSFGVFLLATAVRARIITSPAGIEHRQVLYTIHAPWIGVLRIGDIPIGRHGRTVEGLILAEPASPSSKPIRWWQGYWQMRNKIPLEDFDRNWREGPLGDDLRRYAPHLFAEGDWPDA